MSKTSPLNFRPAKPRETATAFDHAIWPLGRDEFLSKFWRQSFTRITGQEGRFTSFFSWEILNYILEHHPLEPPLLRLFRDGKSVDPVHYFLSLPNGTKRLKPASLVAFLSQGATLILDDVHELAPSLLEVIEAFTDALQANTTINLYAGWGTQKGFDLHWDAQDTMILQVSGRKHWKVYRPTLLHPLSGKNAHKPTGEPIWEGVLEDGDMLYMPRGWWHVAFPLDEPSLHLTVTIVPANGTDLLSWFADGLRQFAEVRMNVPVPASVAEQKEYVTRMRDLILRQWDDNVLDRFMAEWNAIPMRPQFQLPFSPMESRAPITSETRVRLATTPRLNLLAGLEGSVSFSANGVRWECPSSLAPALERLSGSTWYSINELCAKLLDNADDQKLRTFLTSLAMGGAVWMKPRDVVDDPS